MGISWGGLLCATLAATGRLVAGRDVPASLRNLYQRIRAQGSCHKVLGGGFYASDQGPAAFSYCGDYLASLGVVYLSGPSGALADMDIDCDGASGGPADDGRCGLRSSPDLQNQTAFQAQLAAYDAGILDLDTYVHPYVVLGNVGSRSGWRTFDLAGVGVEPLSVVAVVCGDRLVYGIWGDTNGDDGDLPMVGEASYALGTACYGAGAVSGDRGHDAADVLYLAFTGKDAVPGPKGVDWAATSYAAFARRLDRLGDRVVRRIPYKLGLSDKNGAGGGPRPGLGRVMVVVVGVLMGLVLGLW